MTSRSRLLLPLLAALVAASAAAQSGRPPVIGRWDVTLSGGAPSWFEVRRSGTKTLVGDFVGEGGSARPISEVLYQDGRMEFTIPVQWEDGPEKIRMEGRVSGDRITGTMKDSHGTLISWTAERAPSLRRSGEPRWRAPVELFNGRNLEGWETGGAGARNGWIVRDGILRNDKPGFNLVATRKWDDFRIQAEFRYPRGSNSGLYLRGRYEAQIEDNYGADPDSHRIGGIYGFLAPRVNAARRAGEWQTYDITLIGRRITTVFNGETVIDRQEIPGITGGALDSREGEPGPIMLQGDHGVVEFRKLTLTPAETRS